MSLDKLTLSRYLKKVEAEQSTKDNYRKRYEEVRDKITSRWFEVTGSGHMVVYLRIPSEEVKVFYDVLIEFPFGKSSASYKGFRNAAIKVYSNCPSFVYMCARVFDRKGFLIPWTKQLYDPATLAPPPPDKMEEELKKDVKYEKSLYFAAMYLDEMDVIQVLTAMKDAIKVPRQNEIAQYMKSPDQIMKSRTKKQDKLKKKAEKRFSSKDVPRASATSKTGKPTTVSSVKSVARTKKIKHI